MSRHFAISKSYGILQLRAFTISLNFFIGDLSHLPHGICLQEASGGRPHDIKSRCENRVQPDVFREINGKVPSIVLLFTNKGFIKFSLTLNFILIIIYQKDAES